MEWRHSGSPRPKKIPSAKIRWKISRLDFLGSRRHPPHWISSKGPDYKCGVLIIFAGATQGHFEGKTPREGHLGCLVLARQCPGSPGTCNPEETGLPGFPVSWSPTLFSGSCPVGLPPAPWTEKNNWKFATFCPTRRSLLSRTEYCSVYPFNPLNVIYTEVSCILILSKFFIYYQINHTDVF